MLGIAMGCMGMSMDDFCRCTPLEFYEAYDAWNHQEELREQAAWERIRMLCLCTLQPYSQKQLKATDVMRFPWDDEDKEPSSSRSRENELSHEELMERYRKARERMGLG